MQPMIPPKRFDICPPDWGMLRKCLDAFRFFFVNAIYRSILQCFVVSCVDVVID